MIDDPYKVLGVSPNASDDEIKAAYRELVKKYHPDKYQDNPLGDLAEEKLQEINEAYDMIMRGGKNSSGGYSSSGDGYNGAGGYRATQSGPEYQEIRREIDKGNLKRAQDLLDNIPSKQNAEWMFLSGMVSYRRGWYDDAVGKLQQAVSMEPGNMEYRQVLNSVLGAGSMYQQRSYGQGYGNTEAALCQACQCAICLDCCCRGV